MDLVSWGEYDNLDEAPFCEIFNRIGELRSFISENVPFLCLSATVNNNNVDLLCLIWLIYSCNDRQNIKLLVVKSPEKSVDCFEWVFRLIKSNEIECLKILIFCLSFLQLYYITLKCAVCAFRLTHFAFVYYLIARNALFIILTRVF